WRPGPAGRRPGPGRDSPLLAVRIRWPSPPVVVRPTSASLASPGSLGCHRLASPGAFRPVQPGSIQGAFATSPPGLGFDLDPDRESAVVSLRSSIVTGWCNTSEGLVLTMA